MGDAGHLKVFHREDLDRWIIRRRGEVKLGSDVRVLNPDGAGSFSEKLGRCADSGIRYAILGIPEDVGVRANSGRRGARDAWPAFLSEFLNLQSNGFLNPGIILLLGEVDVEDIQRKADAIEGEVGGISMLRQLTSDIDDRVHPIIETIVSAGLEPIIVGGSHNNAYPILGGVEASLLKSGTISDRGIGCVNCDAHLDFRPLEGRHSGNGFSYAFHEGILKSYGVIGLQESYNNSGMLERFAEAGFRFWAYEDFAVRGTTTYEEILLEAVEHFRRTELPIGMEVDLDAMANVPASAEIPYGLSAEQVFRFIHSFAAELNPCYLHITEGAPELGPDGGRKVGRLIAMCVTIYIKAGETRSGGKNMLGKRRE